MTAVAILRERNETVSQPVPDSPFDPARLDALLLGCDPCTLAPEGETPATAPPAEFMDVQMDLFEQRRMNHAA
jgi:hypothetical protein